MTELQLTWLILLFSPLAAYLLAGVAGVAAGVSVRQAFLNFELRSIVFVLVLLPVLTLIFPLVLLIVWGIGSARLARRKGYSFTIWGALCTLMPFLTLILMARPERQVPINAT